jgi:hypothetical protein
MRLNWILLLTVVVTSVAEARPRRSSQVVSMPQAVSMPQMDSMPQFVQSPAITNYAPANVMPASGQFPMAVAPAMGSGGGLAQSKAEMQARAGRCFHPGGSLGGGSHEGCGFSSVSADDAIRHCCYWGQRTPIDIGVARGGNGWYATVIYR